MKINDHGIGKDLQKMAGIDMKKTLLQCAVVTAEEIKKDTQKGIAPDGGKFKQYSDSYKATIKRAKRQKNPNKPNLTWTGLMMKSIVARAVSKTRAIVKQLGANDGMTFTRLMNYNIKMGRDPMGISKRAMKKIDSILNKAFNEL